VAGEARAGERHVELPDLAAIARLDEEVLPRLARLEVAELLEKRIGGGVHVREDAVDAVEVEGARLRVAAPRELRDHVRVEGAAGGEGGGGARQQDVAAAELAPARDDV